MTRVAQLVNNLMAKQFYVLCFEAFLQQWLADNLMAQQYEQRSPQWLEFLVI